MLSELHVWFVGSHAKRGVRDKTKLVTSCGHHRLVGVTNSGDTNASAHVNELVAIDVDQNGAVRPVDVDRQHAVGTSWHYRLPPGM